MKQFTGMCPDSERLISRTAAKLDAQRAEDVAARPGMRANDRLYLIDGQKYRWAEVRDRVPPEITNSCLVARLNHYESHWADLVAPRMSAKKSTSKARLAHHKRVRRTADRSVARALEEKARQATLRAGHKDLE